ncbi:MAG: hypothetical protein ACREON_13240, partial [Gemmatimonadaceae bacterium]
MPTLFVRKADYSAEMSWRLVEWCRARGADEFGLAFLGPPYVPGSAWATLDVLLAPFRRRIASAGDRWLLTGESLAALRSVMAEGLFSAGPGEAAPADPTVYRGGTAFLAVVTRDGQGVFEMRPEDADSLDRAGLPYH